MATETPREERQAWYVGWGGNIEYVIVVRAKNDYREEWRVKGQTANRFHGVFGTTFFNDEVNAQREAAARVSRNLKQAQGEVLALSKRLSEIMDRVAVLDGNIGQRHIHLTQ